MFVSDEYVSGILIINLRLRFWDFGLGLLDFELGTSFGDKIGTNYFVVQNDSLFKTIELMTFNIHSSSRT